MTPRGERIVATAGRSHISLRPGDIRRGCLMLAYAAAGNREGVDAVLDEAREADRTTELTAALLALVVDGSAGFQAPANAKKYIDTATQWARPRIRNWRRPMIEPIEDTTSSGQVAFR